MKIKTLFLALLCLSLPSTTYSEQIYWDCNNDCDISAGLDRNSRNEIFIDNTGSNCLKFIPFTFNNPDSCDFSFKIRLRDGDEIDNASRLLSPSAPSAEFGIVWDYIDSDNYSSAIFKRNTNNHFDEITRKDCFHVAIQIVSNGEKSIVKESDIESKMAFEPNRYNTFQISGQWRPFRFCRKQRAFHPFLLRIYSSKNIFRRNCRWQKQDFNQKNRVQKHSRQTRFQQNKLHTGRRRTGRKEHRQ